MAFLDKKKVLLTAAFAIGALLFVWVIRKVGFDNVVATFRTANLFWLYTFLAISFSITLTLILRWKFILESQHVDVPFWKISLFKLVGFSFSYLTPTGQLGGEPIRGILLKREKVPSAAAYSSVLIDKSIELSTHMTFACIGFIFIILNYSLTRNGLVIIASALGAAVVLLTLFYYGILSNRGFFSRAYYLLRLNHLLALRKYEQQIRDIEIEIANFFKFHKREFRIALGLSLLSWVFMFCEYETALLTFNYSPSILVLFLVICVIGFAYIIPVPAALGVLEISQASLFTVLNVPVSIGIALGLLIRLRDVLWALIGLAYLFNYRVFSSRRISYHFTYRFTYWTRKYSRRSSSMLMFLYGIIKKLARTVWYRAIILRKRFGK
jgi:uncharacterized protein (TIRG00374 family)